MLTIRHVHEGRVSPVDPGAIADARAGGGFVWIDLAVPSPEELAVLDDPAVGLHPMTVEDMREDRHLPKVDVHGEELSLTVHGIALETVHEELSTLELDLGMRSDLLVTYHEQELASVVAVGQRLDRVGATGLDRPIALVHLLLDTMNDVFMPILDHLEQRLDVVEEDILDDPTDTTRRDIYELQRDVIQLRRAVLPQAEVIRRLGRERMDFIQEQDRALFQDLYDHLYRMVGLSDSYLQLLDSAMDSYRSALDDDLNEMLRVLTLISALLLPISVIGSIYGTNFEYIPELTWRGSYFVMWGVFVVIVVGMLTWFRRRRWIGRRAEREVQRRRGAVDQVLSVPVLGRVLEIPVAGARVGAKAVARTRRGAARRLRR